MSDARYDKYQHYGTNAERLAFIPDPPALSGVQPIYIWYETDTLTTWVYSTLWVQITGAGAGAPSTSTYLTEGAEVADLPNSRQVLAGTGITFDDVTPNVRTISAASGLLKSVVPLTNAQILALPTTPITLVAAPGANLYIQPHLSIVKIDCTAGIYTNINATYAALFSYYLGDTSQWTANGIVDDSTYSITKLTGMLAVAGIHKVACPPYAEGPTDGNAGVDWVTNNIIGSALFGNIALAFAADNNGSSNFTGGNAANTGSVITYYTIESY